MNVTFNDSIYSNKSGIIAASSRITWGKVLLGVFLFGNMLVTFIGNVMVLVAVYMEKSLQTAFNFFVVNLAITDVTVAVTAMSFYATDRMLGYWPFGSFLCATWILLDYGMTFASVFTIVAISSDRFWSVFWSLSYRTVNKKKKSIVMLAIVWLITCLLWVPPLVLDRVKNAQSPGVCRWDPAHNRHFVYIIAIVGHHGPCFLMLFFYFLVFFYLRKRVKFGLVKSTQVGPSSKSMNDSSQSQDVPESSNDCKNQSDCSSSAATSSAIPPLSICTPIEEKQPTPLEPFHTMNTEQPTVSPKTLSAVTLMSQTRGGSVDMTNNYTTKKQPHLQVPSRTKLSRSDKNKSVTQNLRDVRRINREMRVFVTLTYIIIGYLVCWVPFHVVFDLTAFDPDLVPTVVYDTTFWLTYVNSTINPFLYNFCSPDFRRAFRKIICRTRSTPKSTSLGLLAPSV